MNNRVEVEVLFVMFWPVFSVERCAIKREYKSIRVCWSFATIRQVYGIFNISLTRHKFPAENAENWKEKRKLATILTE